MKEMRLQYLVSLMIRVLEVTRSGYYAWLRREPSKHTKEDARLKLEIKAAHKRTRESCGPERLQADLADNGVKVGVCRIKRLRKEMGIRCKQVKKFKATTNSKHSLPVAENLLNQNFEVSAPDKVYVSDITYIPTDEGWLYLAGHKDLCSKRIVGYAMAERMTKNLVCESLLKAVTLKRPSKGLINHSDRGSQYSSSDYSDILKKCGMLPSMSGTGNCYDNAPMESFWGTLKQELVYHQRYRTRQEAKESITEYIEVFYNRQRRQAKLGFLSPVAFEQEFYARDLAA